MHDNDLPGQGTRAVSPALPQSIGIGSVAGTALGTLLMTFAGYGEAAVYACAAAGGCLFPLGVSHIRAARSRAGRAIAATNRFGGNPARMAALGR